MTKQAKQNMYSVKFELNLWKKMFTLQKFIIFIS